MAKERKLNIHQAMAAIDQCDGDWLARQSPEAQKEFVPYTALRWAVTIPDSEMAAYYLCVVNERVNRNLWVLQQKHTELIFRLLAVSGLGSVSKHRWLAGPVARSVADKARALVSTMCPDYNEDDITTFLSAHDRASFALFVNECGVQSVDAKAILAAFDAQAEKQTKARQQGRGKAEGQTAR